MISAARNPQGAWQKFERGELALFPFYKAFGIDLSDTDNGNIWYREYCRRKGIGEFTVCEPLWFMEYPCADCPELPKKLNIDGREVSVFVTLISIVVFMLNSTIALRTHDEKRRGFR